MAPKEKDALRELHEQLATRTQALDKSQAELAEKHKTFDAELQKNKTSQVRVFRCSEKVTIEDIFEAQQVSSHTHACFSMELNDVVLCALLSLET